MAPEQRRQQQGNARPFWQLPVVMTVSTVVFGFIVPAWFGATGPRPLPEKAQIIDPKAFLVLDEVLPPLEFNATTVSFLMFSEEIGH